MLNGGIESRLFEQDILKGFGLFLKSMIHDGSAIKYSIIPCLEEGGGQCWTAMSVVCRRLTWLDRFDPKAHTADPLNRRVAEPPAMLVEANVFMKYLGVCASVRDGGKLKSRSVCAVGDDCLPSLCSMVQFPEYWIMGEMSSMVKLYAAIATVEMSSVDCFGIADACKTKDGSRKDEAEGAQTVSSDSLSEEGSSELYVWPALAER